MESGSKVTVLGAGLMGHGIAQVASQVGSFEVSILDVEKAYLDRGMKMIGDSIGKFVEKGKLSKDEGAAALGRIHPTLDLAEAVKGSSLVMEAATEDPKLKLELYGKLAQLAGEDAILASNTSSISITLLGSATKRPENVCGMHFFNPPQLMPLVEIIRGNRTSDETVGRVREASAKLGKETVLCKKDSPGFIVNRLLVPALNEAIFLVQEGVADPEDIDKAVKLGLNWPMGPLQLLDYVGLDTTLNITQVFMNEFEDSKYRPSPLLKEMVRAGLMGRKSGKGFYEWSSPGATKAK
ncbi:MAG: 3-hydroxyacyl-CoA dehydrogenase family protein [Nitrososphaerota archaeon]|jgi:3-hydroxybutyryl-CoA dehydrogenase|nr:3-hydroxyacyl-CoA dehydrogenase family protein [Nitrososphaerota archaeon]MDG6937227.1 3-hydroxyacyl-CoA dehydrogenase family protein [Nitrososphaerota archaeon]MDG6961979.1 3-hydroxyacyl-CoA dehydrogenase family protein [Nitrososphaerota archaeon]MDG6962768.1 3-hydroxyacyl-CoA dehydrogenase family protein [Nitrososphaerota archaeon]MDG6970123.1 3-hydroxyacyl-CoA dehydrogenase family protein [Nitrososphaerota archaeon]